MKANPGAPSRQGRALMENQMAAKNEQEKSRELDLQPELRALDILDVVPSGCMAVRDLNGLCEPHIKIGEFAIADTNDRRPQHGEIFLLRWSNGTMSIMQAVLRPTNLVSGKELCWWVRPMPGARRLATSDGPYSDIEHLKSKIVGRVIGVMADHCAG